MKIERNISSHQGSVLKKLTSRVRCPKFQVTMFLSVVLLVTFMITGAVHHEKRHEGQKYVRVNRRSENVLHTRHTTRDHGKRKKKKTDPPTLSPSDQPSASPTSKHHLKKKKHTEKMKQHDSNISSAMSAKIQGNDVNENDTGIVPSPFPADFQDVYAEISSHSSMTNENKSTNPTSVTTDIVPFPALSKFHVSPSPTLIDVGKDLHFISEEVSITNIPSIDTTEKPSNMISAYPSLTTSSNPSIGRSQNPSYMPYLFHLTLTPTTVSNKTDEPSQSDHLQRPITIEPTYIESSISEKKGDDYGIKSIDDFNNFLPHEETSTEKGDLGLDPAHDGASSSKTPTSVELSTVIAVSVGGVIIALAAYLFLKPKQSSSVGRSQALRFMEGMNSDRNHAFSTSQFPNSLSNLEHETFSLASSNTQSNYMVNSMIDSFSLDGISLASFPTHFSYTHEESNDKVPHGIIHDLRDETIFETLEIE